MSKRRPTGNLSGGPGILSASLLAACVTSIIAIACSGGSSYGAAAAGAAVAVAATGAHRATTKDCWGRCSTGYACNPESGLCEPAECSPSCPEGNSCVVTATGSECRATRTPAVNPMGTQANLSTDGHAPRSLEEAPRGNAPVPSAGRGASGQVQIPRGNPGGPAPSGMSASAGAPGW